MEAISHDGFVNCQTLVHKYRVLWCVEELILCHDDVMHSWLPVELSGVCGVSFLNIHFPWDHVEGQVTSHGCI